jgi:hypothetical protein
MGHDLGSVSSLTQAQRDILERAHITTVENLVGQLHADPDSVGGLLGFDPAGVEELTKTATAVLPSEVREQFAKRQGSHYSYGALNPKRD